MQGYKLHKNRRKGGYTVFIPHISTAAFLSQIKFTWEGRYIMPEEKNKKTAKSIPATQPQGETVLSIPIAELHPFPNHPFKVRDDDAMTETVESAKEYGVLIPAIVRPRKDGGYEIISGHRRKRACELAGLDTMPVIVRNLDDDAATIIMVDSNLQRENILPSERAQAYKMKLEAIRRRAGRPSKVNSCQVGTDLRGMRSDEIVAANSEDSARTIQRYIRLTELSPELQQMVDDKKISMTPAVELSYLKPEEQEMLVTTMDYEQATPSLSQAQRLKKSSQEGKLTEDSMLTIMSEEKKGDMDKVVLPAETLRKYFPKSYTPQRMQETIIKLLEQWQKKRQREQAR